MSRTKRVLIAAAIALPVAAVIVVAVRWLWLAIGGAEMSIHGWVALGIAILGIVVLTMALMGLAFHSARSGHDDRVDDRKRD